MTAELIDMQNAFKALIIAVAILATSVTVSLAQRDTMMAVVVGDGYDPEGKNSTGVRMLGSYEFEYCMATYATLEKSRSEGVPFIIHMKNPDYSYYVNYLFCTSPDGSIHGDSAEKMFASLAQDFQRGEKGYYKGDYATALRELRPLAEQGHAVAQFYLGVMYEHGKGIPQEYKEAVKWYHKSAEQGDMSAQYNLGVMYYLGNGVIQNIVYAHMWMNIAASNGRDEAVKNRDIIAKDMTASQIAEAQKLARECVRKNYKGC